MALAGAVGSTAYAERNTSGEHIPGGVTMRLGKAMTGPDSTISFDQLSSAMDVRLRKLIADNGGKLTVAELVDALEKVHLES
ncbi:hypothetical protein [Mesorhizobium sp.]|uniref:hypothetical protein n=1 Tax=Mesorhizobium sp. TaxID=1871066 RepID=UPI000FE90631|nr:hypothetical protein [Mesorhizobium sp.]RWB53982.1 MAG: hypothetical protein EOQ47_20315 [Mesorhizobium sp.]TKB09796.1 MAG: hypothetical protein E5V75_30005 [Mesorhizobium sp.]